MKLKSPIFLLLFISFSFGLFGQNITLSDQEIVLDSLFKNLRKSKINKEFVVNNNLFKSKLNEVLRGDEAFDYPFETLKTMSKITSPDNKFRLFNWNVEMEGGINRFYCFVLKKNGKIIELRDNYRNISSPELKTLSNKNWYGAVYYKIIKLKNGKYTLLGWNGDDEITTQKVIEIMNLKRKSIKFGESIFKYENFRIRKKRIVMKYANDAFVVLKLVENKNDKEIIFSHISPSTPQLKGHYEYYYPDLSYDKFMLKKGKWIFKEDSQVKNKKSELDKLYNIPE